MDIRKIEHVYFGSVYDAQIDDLVSSVGENYLIRDLSSGTISPEARVAGLVEQGKVIGLFQGGMEYGPRALGNRTILVDPRDRSVNDTVNQRLSRTEYMPFAPVVLAEYADEIFDIPEEILYTCNFMTIIVNVKEEWLYKIPAVVHVDNTARPQIIHRDQNQNYYDIVDEFRKLTGIPVLVNTSFNIHEEPIVESPDDALRALAKGAIDYVYMPPYLVEKK